MALFAALLPPTAGLRDRRHGRAAGRGGCPILPSGPGDLALLAAAAASRAVLIACWPAGSADSRGTCLPHFPRLLALLP